MQELEPTWRRALSVWWLLFWRGIVGGALLGFVAGFIFGLVGGMIHLPKDTITLGSAISGAVVSPIWAIVVVRMALKKQYDKFRVALVPR